MRIYLADTNVANLESATEGVRGYGTPRVLMSYFYFQKRDMDAVMDRIGRDTDTFADSGAVSVHSLGVNVTVHAYGEWLQKWGHIFTHYANLDVKGDVKEGLKNQRILEGMGLKPVPVFHGGEPWSVLRDFITDYPYVALGGMVGHTQSGSRSMWRYLAKAHQMAMGKPVVYHGFGMANWKVLKAFPWYSIDTSGWGSGFRYGTVPIWNPHRAELRRIRIGNKQLWSKHGTAIRALGFDHRVYQDKGKAKRIQLCLISSRSHTLAEQYLEKMYGPIDIKHPNIPTTPASSNGQEATDGSETIIDHVADTDVVSDTV